MVLLNEIKQARQDGDLQTVRAWLDTDEYNNDYGADLLSDICNDFETTEEDVDIARLLLSRGVDANYRWDDGWTLLHVAVSFSHNEYARKIITALIGAGADVNARTNTATNTGSTPLGHLLNTHIFILDALHHSLETVTLLLRAGASLDACRDDDPAEVMLDTNIGDPTFTYERASDPNYVALKTLVAGVRRAGSWKLWTLENTKALLRLRSLIARGRAREKRRLRAKTPREIALLFAPAFPNELFVKVVTYWNPRV